MLLLTRESARWRRATLAALVPLVGAYAWAARRELPHGGSRLGIVYGFLALGLVLLLLFFGVRKRWHGSQLGRLESWCQSHVYLGLLVVAVALLHSGFRLGDRVAVASLAVLLLVAASGLIGAFLYTTVPLLLTAAETNLSPEEMSAQLNQLAQTMTRLASGRSPALRETCRLELDATLPGRLAGLRLLFRLPRRTTDRAFADRSLADVPPADQQRLEQLLVLSRERRELHEAMRRQQRYRNLLAAWLYVHLPLSFVLLLLLAAHVWGAFFWGL